jgi:hypothetical protein
MEPAGEGGRRRCGCGRLFGAAAAARLPRAGGRRSPPLMHAGARESSGKRGEAALQKPPSRAWP